MFSKLAIVALVASTVNALTVSTPASLIECQPASISFSNGTAPYYIAILPGGQSTAAALENLPNSDSSPVTWKVDLAAGTNVTIKVTDGTGTSQYSSPVVIQKGSDTSCIGGASASASASGSAAASGSGTPSGSASGAASSAAQTSGAAFPGAQVGGIVFTVLGLVAATFGVTI